MFCENFHVGKENFTRQKTVDAAEKKRLLLENKNVELINNNNNKDQFNIFILRKKSRFFFCRVNRFVLRENFLPRESFRRIFSNNKNVQFQLKLLHCKITYSFKKVYSHFFESEKRFRKVRSLDA